MGTALAKGARERGKRIALGDGTRVLWDQHSEAVFRYNPNLVLPHESVQADDIEWVHWFKGARKYNTHRQDRWDWNYDWRCEPGEFFFSSADRDVAGRLGLPQNFIVVEPHTKIDRAPYLINKCWPFARYQAVVNALRSERLHVVQFVYGGKPRLNGAWHVETPSYRSAAAILERASLYLGSEGGLHHAAAAVGVPGVVIFGAWIPPQVLGYDIHVNLTGGATEFCGLFRPCEHCAAALDNISVDEVLEAVKNRRPTCASR